MITETMQKIEENLMAHEALNDPAKREELKQLLSQLKSEIQGLSQTHSAQAQNIVGMTEQLSQDVSDKNITREKKDEGALHLSSAVNQFEQSHPKLVEIIGSLSKYLSDIGI